MNRETHQSDDRRGAKRLGYIWGRIRVLGALDLVLGLRLRLSFSKAGVITVTPGLPFPRVINSGGYVEVSNCRFFPGVRMECWKGAELKIGKGTYLNRNTEVVASKSVLIGCDCKIARDVIIMDTDQHAVDQSGNMKKTSVVIEDRVWLGSRAIILKGVQIGHDSVVGAGAVVTKSVPPYSVVVGPAARVIKQLQPQDALEENALVHEAN